MSPTLDYRLKGAFDLLTNNPDNPCLLNVLIYLILHKNGRGRCWVGVRTIAEHATRGDPNRAVHAKRWLIEHDAIKLVPYEKRVGDEASLPKRQHVFQLTGYIRNDDMIYPYLYLSDSDLDEFRKAAEEIAGDIINQVHAKPKPKRMRNHKFIGVVHKNVYDINRVRDGFVGGTTTSDLAATEKIDISSKPHSDVRDVHNMDAPNLSISNISRYSTTYQEPQYIETPDPQKSLNPDLVSAELNNIKSRPIATESDQLTSALLQNNKISEVKVFVDGEGDPIVDPNLVIIAPNGFTTYICPACRSYVTQNPNQLCSKCRNKGVSVNVETIKEEELKEQVTSKRRYGKEVSSKVDAVQKAIRHNWPGKSQAYGWVGRIAQMMVGVTKKEDGDFYTHRFRQPATPDEVIDFIGWWDKYKAQGRKNIELPSSPDTIEKFFSEFREFQVNERKKKEQVTRKYIDINMDDYR